MKFGYVYYVGLATKLLGSGILNFGPFAARGHFKVSPVGGDDRPGGLLILFQLVMLN